MLKNLVTPLLGLALLAAPAAAHAPKTRLAHIGLGLDGSWSWVKEALAEPDAELLAVADPRPELIEKVKAMTPAGTK